MINEDLELIPNPKFIKEFGGYIAYKGVSSGEYYFVRKEKYEGLPTRDRYYALTVLQRCHIAFRNLEPIPKEVSEYLPF